MSDDAARGDERADRAAALRGNGNGADTFDVLGTEIAALLRSTHEISARTRREADEEAKTRLTDATRQAQIRLAEAEEQAQAQLAAANERLAQADREVEARLAAANERAVEIARREEAATVLLGLVTELAARLEKRAKRSLAESQATVDELAALKAALPGAPEATTSGAPPTGADAVIDLRDPEPAATAAEPALPKRKEKHKRRRKGSSSDGPLLTRSRSSGPTDPA